MHIQKTIGEPPNKLITPTAMKIIIKTFKTIGNLFAEHELSFNVNEAKHDNYCTDYNGTNWDKCDIYKKYS